MRTPKSGRRRFPGEELLRFLVLPIILTVIVILVFMKPWRLREPAREGAYEQVLLVQKGAMSAITSLFGGASGDVWYTPDGPTLAVRLSAKNLTPGKRYIFEMQVDSTIYDVASLPAGDDGQLALDTSFTTVAEGICVGGNYDHPRQLATLGAHRYTIGFMLKRDGSAATGSQRAPGGSGATGAELPCKGNGDGDYAYALMQNSMAHFTP